VDSAIIENSHRQALDTDSIITLKKGADTSLKKNIKATRTTTGRIHSMGAKNSLSIDERIQITITAATIRSGQNSPTLSKNMLVLS